MPGRILSGIFGLSAGFTAAGGIFALITSVGVLTRLAGKTHTASHILKYEMAVMLGGIAGNLLTVYELEIPAGKAGAGILGLFSGIFVGCLATSLAESLNVTAVFSRRAKLKSGLGYIVLSLALGKMIGSLLFYYKGW